LPFEKPKLAVKEYVEGSDFAAMLERAIARSRGAIIDASSKAINGSPVGPEPTPLGAPMPRLRRF
jgi:hypothetical protein